MDKHGGAGEGREGKRGWGVEVGAGHNFCCQKKKKSESNYYTHIPTPSPNCIPIAKPDGDYFLRLKKRKPSDQVWRWGHLPDWEDPEKRDLKSRIDDFFF